jgi:hypothetical protein
MPSADLDDRLDRLLRTVEDGVTAGDPAALARGGRRRRLVRRTAGAGAVAALLAAVVVVASLLPDRVPRPAAPTVATGPALDGVPDGVVPWSGARVTGDPRELVVTVQAGGGARSRPSDPCWEGYQPEARSEADRMVVTVRRFRSRATLAEGHGCAAVGVLWNVTVPLPDDLRGRRLEDGATGERRPLVQRLLAPRWLPDGWALLLETAGDGERWRREYGPVGARPTPDDAQARPSRVKVPPGPAEQVTVVEIPPRLLGAWNRWPDTPVVGHTQVRGSRAEIDADPRDRNVNVRWREGDVAYVVTGHARQGAKLRHVQEVVVQIAQSLR